MRHVKAMQLYANPDRPDHAENNATFLRVVNSYPTLAPFQPSPERAPWHWQAVIDLGRDVQILNFWPHTMKAQRDGFKAVEGESAMRAVIEAALEDAAEEPFDVIEAGE
jgi:hypothetical protein